MADEKKTEKTAKKAEKKTSENAPAGGGGGKARRQRQHLRQQNKALAHAVKRGASEYVQARIKGHIAAVAAGKAPQSLPERDAFRKEGRQTQKASDLRIEGRPRVFISTHVM